MTVIQPNSISGINSITAQGGDLNLFRADGTKADIPTVNNITAGIITATTFSGNLSGGTINATSGTVTGNLGVGGVLTYEDVTNIDSVGVITARSGIKIGATGANTLISGTATGIGINETTPDDRIEIRTTAHGQGVTIKSTGNTSNALTFDANRSGANNGISNVYGRWNGTTIAQMSFNTGSDTTDKNDGYIWFGTESAASNGNVNATERLRIPSTGGIELKTDGKGIQFPIPQTPTNANSNRVGISSEMRYYETGTTTPGLSSTVLNSLQLPAFTDASYARRVCRYVRVGHLVHVTAEIKMASSVTYANGSTSTAPPCITGITPFRYGYSERFDVSGQPDFYPCSISYDSSNLTNDTLYAVLRRDFPAEARFEITKPGSGGSRQSNSTNFGEVFPANAHIIVSCTYAIDTSNADY